MDALTYQQEAEKAMFHDLSERQRLTLGVLGLQGKLGKLVEDFFLPQKEDFEEKMNQEVGDVLWYMAILSTAIRVGFNEILYVNPTDLPHDRFFWESFFESGKLSECVEHYNYHLNGKQLDTAFITDRLRTIAAYLTILCATLTITLEGAMQANIDKLRARHPEQFVPRYESGDSR